MCVISACVYTMNVCGAGRGEWMTLSAQQVVFVSGHTHNVLRMLNGKNWEGKSKTAGAAIYMVYCSTKTDRAATSWPSGQGVAKGAAHIICRITGYNRPGREDRPVEMGGGKWAVDWTLDQITRLSAPDGIALPKGVGRGALHPGTQNNHLIAPFAKIKWWLQNHGPKRI